MRHVQIKDLSVSNKELLREKQMKKRTLKWEEETTLCSMKRERNASGPWGFKK